MWQQDTPIRPTQLPFPEMIDSSLKREIYVSRDKKFTIAANKDIKLRLTISMAFTIVCEYLQPKPILRLQHLCHRFYKKDVARAQMKIRYEKELRFGLNLLGDSAKHIFSIRMDWPEAKFMRSPKLDFKDMETFAVGRDMYTICPGNLAVTKYTNTHTPRTIEVSKDLCRTPFSRKLFSITLALQDFRVYVSGGRNEKNQPTTSCIYFNIRTEQWCEDNEMPDMIEPRFNHGSCSFDKYLYVLGGSGLDGQLETI